MNQNNKPNFLLFLILIVVFVLVVWFFGRLMMFDIDGDSTGVFWHDIIESNHIVHVMKFDILHFGIFEVV